jgi:NRAMP (natural resistance-associated macrophage protein)-like metal ion transporter
MHVPVCLGKPDVAQAATEFPRRFGRPCVSLQPEHHVMEASMRPSGHATPDDSESPGKKALLNKLGAGLITGAADDDPSGIATYSQVGAAYGYGTLWTVVLALPLMIGIQTICARIGRVTGKGLAANIRSQYPVGVVMGFVLLLFIANIINLSADIGAMGAAMKLLIGGPAFAYAAGFACLSVVLQVLMPFDRYSPLLKLMTFSLFAYVGTVLVVHVPWLAVLKGTFFPHMHLDATYAVAVVAVFGTTISPYLFFWQSSQEANEVRIVRGRKALKRASQQGPAALRRISVDTVTGMLFSELVAFFIILTAAVVLHAHGKTDIQTSSDAAAALLPIAGKFAFWLFATGIIGTGLLALPVLAGSCGYALGEAFRWKTGLEAAPRKARLFYATIAVATLLGVLLSLSPMDPIKMLFWSAVINGVIAVPLMVVIMLLGAKRTVMGRFTIPLVLTIVGWLATLVMAAAAVVMFATWGS